MAIVPCRRCGGEVVQKPRTRLVLVGTLLLAAVSLGPLWTPLCAHSSLVLAQVTPRIPP